MGVRWAGPGIRLPDLNPGPTFLRCIAYKLVKVSKIPFSVRWDHNDILGL